MPRVIQKFRNLAFGNADNNAIGVQEAEMADARMGVLYFLGNSKPGRLPLHMNLLKSFSSNFIGNTAIFEDTLSGEKNASLWLIEQTSAGRAVTGAARNAGNSITDWTADKLEPITRHIRQFFSWLQGQLGAVYGITLDVVEWIGEFFIWAASTFTRTLADAIPYWHYVGQVSELYEGVRDAVAGAILAGSQLYRGWGVNLLGGHPSIIANAIARHSATMIGGGLATAGLAAGDIGIAIAADVGAYGAGVGSIVSAVKGFLLQVLGLIDRITQRVILTVLFKRARHHWKRAKSGKGIATDHDRFSKWFQTAVVTTPVVAALVVCSGFAAHPLRFLKLIDTEGNASSQKSFSDGIRYIDELKRLGGKYVRGYVDNYRTTFKSDDQLIKTRLNEIISGKGIVHETELSPLIWHQNPLFGT